MPNVNTLQLLTRLGFAARGVMYLLIGYLALRMGRTEDGAGALEWLGNGGGRVVLIAMAVGFLAYALWRLSEAAIDTEGHGSDAKGAAVRFGGAVSGLIHLSLCWLALSLAMGSHKEGGDAAEQGASVALALPGGQIAVVLGAITLFATGAYQLVKAFKLGFLKHIDPAVSRRPWIAWLGRAGYSARGVVFVVMAIFLWRASRQSRADAAGGMGQAIDAMPVSIQILVAVGLLMFGFFSLIEARFRRINDPKVLKRLKQAASG